MRFVPLTDVWAYSAQAAILFGLLENAGFHPVTQCDLHGWMNYFYFPLGSERPITIWVPESESAEALELLSTPHETSWEATGAEASGYWAAIRSRRRAIFAVWLIFVLFMGMSSGAA